MKPTLILLIDKNYIRILLDLLKSHNFIEINQLLNSQNNGGFGCNIHTHEPHYYFGCQYLNVGYKS